MAITQRFSLPHIDVYLQELPTGLPKREAEEKGKEALLRIILEDGNALRYTAQGKPTLDKGYISISHTKRHICMAYSATQPIGIDIEDIQPRLIRLKDRYLLPYENEKCPKSLLAYAISWSAKEALYKLIGEQAGAIGENIQLSTQHIPADLTAYEAQKSFVGRCNGHDYTLHIVTANEAFEIVLAVQK